MNASLSPEEATFLQDAINYYRDHRPYFYVFLRPYELLLFHRIREHFKPPIADFGCGDGFFVKFLFPAGGIEFGIDRDSAIASAARHVFQSVIFVNNSHIELPSESVRTVLANSVFEHLTHPQQILRELNRILQPGGRAFVTVTVKHWETCLMGTQLFGILYKQYMRIIQRHHAMFDLETWRKMLETTGFRINGITGYLDAETVKLIDIFHYLAVPSLLAKKVCRTWNPVSVKKLNALFYKKSPPKISNFPKNQDYPCYFFELDKMS